MKIGVLTGGGDCPGLNGVIRAIVKSATLLRGWEVIGIRDSFEGLLDPIRIVPLDGHAVRGILNRGGTILGTSNRGHPFAYPSHDGPRDRSAEIVKQVEQLALDAIIAIGGDGTMRICQQFAELGLNLVGVPKTIDNDLLATEVTFGFDTACGIALEALDRLYTTAESHHRVMLLEVMGRNAGWIALHAGIGGGCEAILLPEIPYRIEVLRQMIEQRREQGAHFSVIIVAEGAKPQGGEASLVQPTRRGENPRHQGAAERVAEALCRNSDLSARCTVLGHVQRGGSPSLFDRVLATRLGTAAVELVAERRFSHMVAVQQGAITAVSFELACAGQKLVDPNGDLVMTARACGVVFG